MYLSLAQKTELPTSASYSRSAFPTPDFAADFWTTIYLSADSVTNLRMRLRSCGRNFLTGGLLWCLACLTIAAPARILAAEATNGIVASVDALATEAGLAVLRQGGNAIDATVAVA